MFELVQTGGTDSGNVSALNLIFLLKNKKIRFKARVGCGR